MRRTYYFSPLRRPLFGLCVTIPTIVAWEANSIYRFEFSRTSRQEKSEQKTNNSPALFKESPTPFMFIVVERKKRYRLSTSFARYNSSMGSTKCLHSNGHRSSRFDEMLERKRPMYSVQLRAPVQTCCGHKFSCRRFFLLRKIRRNDPSCPVDNEPLLESEQAAGGQLSEVHLSTEELQHFARPSSRVQTHQPSFPIQEQHPHLQPLPFCGLSRPVEADVGARLRYQDENFQLPYQPEDGNQASGWSGFGALGRGNQGGGRGPPGLSLGFQQTQGGGDCSGLNVPSEEEGQDAIQRYGRNDLQNRVTPAKQKEVVSEHCCGTQEVQLWNDNLRRLLLFDEAILSQIEGRICSGTYHWRIRNFQQCREDAVTGATVAQFSPAIYTSLYGYTFCMRIYLNGVNSGVGTHVALYVHMMQGECDNRLVWPFTGVITLSILDQSGAKVPKDITQVLVASPTLCAFRQPTAPCSQIGCGFEFFAPIAQICAGPFVQNNTMLVKIEISR